MTVDWWQLAGAVLGALVVLAGGWAAYTRWDGR